MSNRLRAVVLGAAIAMLIASCIVKRLSRPQLTGTCDGACAHYIACKPRHSEDDRVRCQQECPQVFSDPDSLISYELLSCPDAVEYVDGTATTTVGHSP